MKMIIKLIGKRIKIKLFSVAYYSGHNTDDILIRYSVFLFCAMIAAYDVIVFPDLQDPVKNVHSIAPYVKWTIILFESSVRTLNDHNVTVLPKQRHHTCAYVSINYLAVFTKLLFKRRFFSHLSHRSFLNQRQPFLRLLLFFLFLRHISQA